MQKQQMTREIAPAQAAPVREETHKHVTVKDKKEEETLQHYLTQKYPVEIVEDEDGTIVASIPDLPGCVSFGDTPEDALKNLNETKLLWLKGRIASGEPVPSPTDIEDYSGKFVLRIPRSLHRSLDREAKKQGVSLNQYILHLLSERHAVSKIESALTQSAQAKLEPSDWGFQPMSRGGCSFSAIAIQGPEPSRESLESLLLVHFRVPKKVRLPMDLPWREASFSEACTAPNVIPAKGKTRHAR